MNANLVEVECIQKKRNEEGEIKYVWVRPAQGLVSPAGQGSGVPRAMTDLDRIVSDG